MVLVPSFEQTSYAGSFKAPQKKFLLTIWQTYICSSEMFSFCDCTPTIILSAPPINVTKRAQTGQKYIEKGSCFFFATGSTKLRAFSSETTSGYTLRSFQFIEDGIQACGTHDHEKSRYVLQYFAQASIASLQIVTSRLVVHSHVLSHGPSFAHNKR